MSRFLFSGIGAGLLLVAGSAFAQTPAALLAFDVASIKPSGAPDPQKMMSGQMHIGLKITGNTVDIGFQTLGDLIGMAYKVKYYQIQGPDWMTPGAPRFDIVAKMPEGATKEQMPEMLQTLLADRFKLTVHHSSKDNQVYALIVGKNGVKMKESPPDEPAPAADGSAPPAATGMTVKGTPESGMTINNGPNGTQKMTMANGMMHLETSKMSMSQFAETLSRFLDHPVVDMTELKGNYQVALDISMEDMMNAAKAAGMQAPPAGAMGGRGGGAAEAASDPGVSSLFNNVQQLGLKLESRKSPVESIVIDHLEKVPTEN
jgi:uncharacterized protein (TIGR03435 family)